MPLDHYMLREDGTIEACDAMEWALFLGDMQARRIWYTQRGTGDGAIEVSTVFLGLDHNHTGKGGPILFETMVTAEDYEDMLRYRTMAEAVAGHREVLASLGVEDEWPGYPNNRDKAPIHQPAEISRMELLMGEE